MKKKIHLSEVNVTVETDAIVDASFTEHTTSQEIAIILLAYLTRRHNLLDKDIKKISIAFTGEALKNEE